MTNRDHLVDGLHSILEELWNGSNEKAAAEFRVLAAWRTRTIKPGVPTYRAGTFPSRGWLDAQNLPFLESAAPGMREIELAWSGDPGITAERVKDLLSYLSEQRSEQLPVYLSAALAGEGRYWKDVLTKRKQGSLQQTSKGEDCAASAGE